MGQTSKALTWAGYRVGSILAQPLVLWVVPAPSCEDEEENLSLVPGKRRRVHKGMGERGLLPAVVHVSLGLVKEVGMGLGCSTWSWSPRDACPGVHVWQDTEASSCLTVTAQHSWGESSQAQASALSENGPAGPECGFCVTTTVDSGSLQPSAALGSHPQPQADPCRPITTVGDQGAKQQGAPTVHGTHQHTNVHYSLFLWEDLRMSSPSIEEGIADSPQHHFAHPQPLPASEDRIFT